MKTKHRVAINNIECNNEIIAINYLKVNKTITNKDLRVMDKIKEAGTNKILRGLFKKISLQLLARRKGYNIY